MRANAVIFEAPERLAVRALDIEPGDGGDVELATRWSGVSAGTERLFWTGSMPPFPGMGYPLVPGYETVAEVIDPREREDLAPGDLVFAPGARCFGPVRGLFGGAAARLVTKADRVHPIPASVGADGVGLALAATARHVLDRFEDGAPDLVVGHGALSRLALRLLEAEGLPLPVVWEKEPRRREGRFSYSVIDPADDDRHDYGAVLDVSGDARILDALIARLRPRGRIVLAGFYADRPSFDFPNAFLREIELIVAAEFRPADLDRVARMAASGALDLSGVNSHSEPLERAAHAYRTAFGDPSCLKMTLNWEGVA